MASVAVAQHRNLYHCRKKINCRLFHTFHPKSPPKSSTFPSSNPKDSAFIEDLSYSELWAGPAYTNSPPPSELPIPKFSLRRALNQPGAKSAPASPKSESGSSSSSSDFFVNTASATENLKRILNLDV